MHAVAGEEINLSHADILLSLVAGLRIVLGREDSLTLHLFDLV